MMRADITKVPDDESDGDEGWVRDTDEPALRNVDPHRFDDARQVTVRVAELLREDPLEGGSAGRWTTPRCARSRA